MNPFKSIVIARQLEELRTESSVRRLARTASRTDEAPKRPSPPRRRWSSVLDDPAIVLAALGANPYPAR